MAIVRSLTDKRNALWKEYSGIVSDLERAHRRDKASVVSEFIFAYLNTMFPLSVPNLKKRTYDAISNDHQIIRDICKKSGCKIERILASTTDQVDLVYVELSLEAPKKRKDVRYFNILLYNGQFAVGIDEAMSSSKHRLYQPSTRIAIEYAFSAIGGLASSCKVYAIDAEACLRQQLVMDAIHLHQDPTYKPMKDDVDVVLSWLMNYQAQARELYQEPEPKEKENE